MFVSGADMADFRTWQYPDEEVQRSDVEEEESQIACRNYQRDGKDGRIPRQRESARSEVGALSIRSRQMKECGGGVEEEEKH